MYLHSFFVGLAVVAGAVGAEAAEKPRTDLYGDPLPDGAVLRLGTTRLRSNAKLIQFTPDGRMLITTEQGRIVKHWNAEDGEAREVFTLPLPSWSPEALSPDGAVYVGGDGEGVCAWEIATGRLLYKLAGVLSNQVAFSPDGATLAIQDSSQQLTLWDARTGAKRSFSAAKYTLWGLAFSPDGSRLAVSLSDMRIVCLDAATGRELWKTDARSYQAAWSRDGGSLAVCMSPSAEVKDAQSPVVIRFLNAADGKPTGQEPVAPPGGAAIPQYSSDGAYLAYLTTDAIGVWDVKKGKVLCNLPLTTGANNGGVPFAIAPNGKTLAAVVGCTLHCWDVATGKDLYPDVTGRGPNGLVKAVALSSDGKRIATMSWGLDPRPCIWDASTGKLLRTLPIPEKAQWFAFFLAFSPDGKRLFSATTYGKVRCWEVDTGKEVWSGDPLNAKAGGGQSLAQLCLSVDGSRLFLLRLLQNGCPGPAELSVRDAATGECKLTVPVPSGCSTDVLSPDELRFVSGGAAFDMQTGDLRYKLRANNEIGANNGNEFGAVSADGALVAAPLSSREQRGKGATQKCRGVQVWVTATGARVALLPETEFGVLAISPDCRTVAVVCRDDIRLWDLITCTEVERIPVTHRLLGYNPPLAFSPDGMRLVVGCADTTAVV